MTDDIKMLRDFESKLDRLCSGQDVLQDKQTLMAEDVSKIKDAVYNPDQGLYARLRELESWKATSSKMIWTLFTSLVGLIAAFVIKTVS